ncbi:hypothetical protein [Streptomyces zagrosensis]|uniref:Uncharacterized protein n=1 Tax=Streptomyces zagrosensis TaxID=1042984 RepID=A0A7W9V1K6_9ACTN|nr:hypothetical protein [Streptomyces zagrosensis]MBB5939032.1 hypothetical protein [Streptomyces zagrosensis]
MSNASDSIRGTVFIQHHTFSIVEEAEENLGAENLPLNTTGLVEIEDGQARIITGIHTGDVEVQVTCHPSALTATAVDAVWQEVVEVPVETVSGKLYLWMNSPTLPEGEPALLSPHGPGTYRLRVHARGRDTATDNALQKTTEQYLIQVWPALTRPVTVLRATDQCGAEHRENTTEMPPRPPRITTTTDPGQQLLRERGARLRSAEAGGS